MLKLKRFYFKEKYPWEYEFGPVELSNGLNLLIGKSGTGKTKFLNIITNISNKLGRGLIPGVTVQGNIFELNIQFEDENNKNIIYNIIGEFGEQTDTEIVLKQSSKNIKISEELIINDVKYIERENTKINLLIEKKEVLITLNSSIIAHEIPFAEQETITKIRTFFGGLMRLNESFGFNQIRFVVAQESPMVVSSTGDFLEASLYLFKEKYPENYKKYLNTLKEFFPSIENLNFRNVNNSNDISMFIKESLYPKEYYYMEASSGMHRIMGILNIIFSPILKTLICIDEIDNGIDYELLGKLFELIDEHANDFQVIATSHHPHWQDKTRLENWIIIKNMESRRRFHKIDFSKLSPLYKSNKYANSKLLFEKEIPLLEMK